MNNVFTAKLLNNLRNKKGEKGFTLIELLVVVIIIGVLAAVALPNLLGQVGKARESEAKNIVGALTRAQQSRYVERSNFAGTALATVPQGIPQQGQMAGDNYIGLLEVPTTAAKYYAFGVLAPGVQVGTGNYDRDGDGTAENNNLNDGTRDYVGALNYDQDTRDFQTVLCRSMSEATGYLLNTDVLANGALVNQPADGIIPADGNGANAPQLACSTAAGASETEEVR